MYTRLSIFAAASPFIAKGTHDLFNFSDTLKRYKNNSSNSMRIRSSNDYTTVKKDNQTSEANKFVLRNGLKDLLSVSYFVPVGF